MAKNPGSLLNPETKQPFEALTYNFYENDMVKILQKYSDHFAQQQGHNAYLLTAKREGGDFFRIIKKDIDDDPLVAIDTSDAVGELTSRAMTTAGRVGIEATETIDGSVDQFAIDPIGTLQRIVRQKNVLPTKCANRKFGNILPQYKSNVRCVRTNNSRCRSNGVAG
jgi:hypothetical protein